MDWKREASEMRLAYSDSLIEFAKKKTTAFLWWKPI